MVAASVSGAALVELGAVLLGLAVLGRFAWRFGLPSIPLYLVAGLLVGEGGLDLHASEEFIRVGADLGHLVRDEVDQHVRSVLVEVPGGARGEGVKRDAFAAKVADALDSFRNRRREAVLSRFREGQGRGGGAVTALVDVIEVLRRGQVDELVLHESTLSGGLADKELWVGPEPLQLGTSSGDLDALGVAADARRKLPAGVALLRAALGQDAGVTFAEDGSAELVDGIGAVLRWSDGSTPSESVPTQSADQRRLRNVV